MALIGYARLSALEDENWSQHDALEAAGCARIFTDRASGVHDERPELARCFDHLREGDVVLVTKLDRLGRSLRDLVDTITALGEREVGLRSLDEAIDTTTSRGAAVFGLCTALTEFELDLVRERTALAAVGIREPRLGAFAEAARSLPPWRAAPEEPPDAQDDEPVALAKREPSPARPARPARRVRPGKPAKLAKSAQPTEPADPTEPTQPAAFTEPTEPTEPSESTEPAAAAVAPRPKRTGLRRRALVGAQIGVSLAAAVAAFHVARSGADTSSVVLKHMATNHDVALRFPAGWRRTSADLAVAALGLDDAIVLALGPTGGSTLMAGMSPAAGATLLPPAVLRRLGSTPRPVNVRLGGHVAQRYADLRLTDLSRRMTVTVVPTTRGALTLACVARPQDMAALADVCDGVAQSMRPTRGRVLALGPSTRYQGTLNALVGNLDATRRARRAQLASARTAPQQAQVAAQLSTAYAAARTTGSDEIVSPREIAAHGRILAALDATRAAYERLSDAARSASVTHYDRARTAVADAERRLRSTLAALRPLGYAAAAVRSAGGS